MNLNKIRPVGGSGYNGGGTVQEAWDMNHPIAKPKLVPEVAKCLPKEWFYEHGWQNDDAGKLVLWVDIGSVKGWPSGQQKAVHEFNDYTGRVGGLSPIPTTTRGDRELAMAGPFDYYLYARFCPVAPPAAASQTTNVNVTPNVSVTPTILLNSKAGDIAGGGGSSSGSAGSSSEIAQAPVSNSTTVQQAPSPAPVTAQLLQGGAPSQQIAVPQPAQMVVPDTGTGAAAISTSLRNAVAGSTPAAKPDNKVLLVLLGAAVLFFAFGNKK